VHVLTAPALAGRPVWVREGAAIYYSGEQPQRGDTVPRGKGIPAACPTDRELLQPSSAEALGLAYRRAAACFADQLRAGKTWRDIAR
jgi:hypothetical protein